MTRWILATLVLILTAAPVVGDRSAADRALRSGNRAEAVRIWAAQATQGDREAQHRLAWALEEGIGVQPDLATAARHYRAAAEQGHVGAQTALATFYHEGRGVEQDHAEARRWAEAAAAQGSAGAAHLLGRLHILGEGVAVDPAEAFRWFLVAERRGHVSAAHDRRHYGRLVAIETRREIRTAVLQQIAY